MKNCTVCGEKMANKQQEQWHESQHKAQKLNVAAQGFKAAAAVVFLLLFIYLAWIILF